MRNNKDNVNTVNVSLSPGVWEYANLSFQGFSLAGVRTSITLPPYSIAFDLAQGLPHAIRMNTFLITHGHMDHASGIPYVIAQKAMNSHKPPLFLMPESMVEPMREIMRQWSLIEGHQYDYIFQGVRPGDSIPLQSKIFIRPFKTLHRIPSVGYSVYRKSTRLRSDLVGLSSEEIAEVRKKGESPTEDKDDLLVSFTGDTQIEFLDLSPKVRESKILIMEATYLDERKSIESAKAWGHLHLKELIPRLSEIRSERIVLIHSSARYSIEEAREVLQKQLPESEHERVVLFPGR